MVSRRPKSGQVVFARRLSSETRDRCFNFATEALVLTDRNAAARVASLLGTVSYVLRCVLARRVSIQMRFLYAKPSRDNPAVPNDTSVPPQMDMFQTGTSDGYLSKHKFYDSRALIFLSMFVFTER